MHISTDLVLQAVSPAFQVHLFCVWVIETTLAQFAVETNDLSFIIADLEEVHLH